MPRKGRTSRRESGAGDQAENRKGLQALPDTFQQGAGNAQQMLHGMTRGKAEKNEAKGKEQPVHKNVIRLLASGA